MTTEVKLENQEESKIDEVEDALDDATKAGDDTEDTEVTKDKEEEEGEEVKETPDKDKVVLEEQEGTRELKQIIRQQTKDMAIMRAKMNRLEKRSMSSSTPEKKDVDDIFSDESEERKEDKAKDDSEELSKIEILESNISNLGEQKGPLLETLLETMEQNPKYNDIREVCSQAHFDDVFEAVGKAVADKDGVDSLEASLEFELGVWSRANPYKYMYGLIKEHHKDYAKEKDKAKDTDTEEDKLKATDAPTSIANMGGGDRSSKAGWTAEKIDNLPEDELNKVPEDVYDKYLAGKLD